MAFSDVPNTLMKKTYYLSTIFQADWMGAMNFCRINGLQLVSLESLEEANMVLNALVTKKVQLNFIFVDGVTTQLQSTDQWFNFISGKRMNYSVPWTSGEPNNNPNPEACLSTEANGAGYGLNDFTCKSGNLQPFICQDIIVEKSRGFIPGAIVSSSSTKSIKAALSGR